MTKTKGTKEWAVKNVNFSVGCENNCKYCYAKAMAYRFGRIKNREEWANMQNKPEMAKKRFKKVQGWIMSPSSHDVTLNNIDLAIKVFKNILKLGNNLLIVTKPHPRCIYRLCNELQNYKDHILFRFTITTNDDSVRAFWEPNAPDIRSRKIALIHAYGEGYRTSISIEPFLDNTVVKLATKLLDWVTDDIWIGPMNFNHLSSDLITPELKQLYSKENLQKIKSDLDQLHDTRIRYKDHFLNRLQYSHSQPKPPTQKSLKDFFTERQSVSIR